MAKLPSRLRRLDEILYDLPVDEPMLLSELDGYLAAIAVSPEAIEPVEWLPPIWGGLYGEAAPFDDLIDRQLFADMVQARLKEIRRDLDRGKYQAILDTDERNGDLIWEIWMEGFILATSLRAGGWLAFGENKDEDALTALSHLLTLRGIMDRTTELTSIEINAIEDQIPVLIPAAVALLHSARSRIGGITPGPREQPAKVGRNDPCPCGSGKKHKRCCGAG